MFFPAKSKIYQQERHHIYLMIIVPTILVVSVSKAGFITQVWLIKQTPVFVTEHFLLEWDSF